MEIVRKKRNKKKDTRIAVTIEDALNIFTDGSCMMHDRRQGGIGVRYVLYDDDLNEQIIEPWLDGYADATISEMELQAIIEALKYAMKNDLTAGKSRIIVFSDSMYVVEHFSRAKYQWCNNGWCNAYGRPIENADQWKELVRLVAKIGKPVEIQKVKGHSKDPNNKAVDKLAKRSAQAPLRKSISSKSVRRKKTEERTNVGSVVMEGQRISIRIVTCEYESLHGLFKLRYEVVSKGSPYKGKMDLIFSDQPLRDGHTYYVVFNTEPLNPRIKKVIREC